MPHLNFVKRQHLNVLLWDSMVKKSDTGSIFCYSWYLDHFCEWDVVLYGKYQGGIALPKKRKIGISRIYQPNFVQQCVWVGAHRLTKEEEVKLYSLIISHFSLVHFNCDIPLGNSLQRVNLVLPLKNTYQTIQQSFSKTVRKNIRKASSEVKVTQSVDIETVISLYRKQWGHLNPQLTDRDYNQLKLLAKKRPEAIECYIVWCADEAIAGLVLAKGKNRLHYILGASTDKGKKLRGLTLGLDHIIRSYAASNTIFDFEGSSIPSVKSFYESFGGQNEPFFQVSFGKGIPYLLKRAYNSIVKS